MEISVTAIEVAHRTHLSENRHGMDHLATARPEADPRAMVPREVDLSASFRYAMCGNEISPRQDILPLARGLIVLWAAYSCTAQARVAQAFGGAISRLKLKFEIHDLTDVKTIPKMEFVKALRSVAPGEPPFIVCRSIFVCLTYIHSLTRCCSSARLGRFPVQRPAEGDRKVQKQKESHENCLCSFPPFRWLPMSTSILFFLRQS